VVKEISGVDFPIIEAERCPGDPASLVVRADRVRRELEWEPRLADQRLIIEDAWQWESKLAGGR